MRSGRRDACGPLATHRAPARVIAVCSGKGGVGKTSIASNTAVALGAMGLDVCLLDADVSLANVDVLLGLEPRLNLSHVVKGEAALDETILQGPRNVRVIPASSGNFCMTNLPAASQAAIIQAFADLDPQPDVLVVDTAGGISPSVARFVQASQHPLVVIEDEPASLTDAYALIKVFSRNYGVRRFNIVTNRTANNVSSRMLFDKLARVTDAFLDVMLNHLGGVPNDRYLARAVREQRAVVDAYPLSSSSRSFLKIAKAIEQLRPRAQPSGGLEFFFESLLDGPAPLPGQVA